MRLVGLMVRRFLVRCVATAAVLCTGALQAGARALPDRVLLVPLDDRPAAWQFAQMIGDIADVQVETPPIEMLGHFTYPGRADDIIEWLDEHLGEYDAAILSTDMVAFGGLIASRTDRSSQRLAEMRLERLSQVLRKHRGTRTYAFSTLTRIAPTAVKENSKWRLHLARFVAMRTEYHTTGDRSLLPKLSNLRALIPAKEITRYDEIRARNHAIQQRLLGMTEAKDFGFLVFGQDDAQQIGPHVSEIQRLKAEINAKTIAGSTLFASGIDQISNLLLSRSLMDSVQWTPDVRVVFADEQGKLKVAFYEAEPVDKSLMDQILGSGARQSTDLSDFDYTLYVNTPDPREFALDAFLRSLQSEVDQGMPIAVADVNLGNSGTADSRVFEALMQGGRSSRLLAYAGWNTAGNTMGTTVPAANVYLVSRRAQVDPLHRETSLRKFILHRLVNDYEYHRFVRPQAYSMIDSMPKASREEAHGDDLAKVDDLVREEMSRRLRLRFDQQLKGSKFFAGNQEYEVVGLRNVDIRLPWPRAYEVLLKFGLEIQPVHGGGGK